MLPSKRLMLLLLLGAATSNTKHTGSQSTHRPSNSVNKEPLTRQNGNSGLLTAILAPDHTCWFPQA